MIAEYKENVYLANVRDSEVTLLTYYRSKSIDGFESKRDYFKKSVSIDEPNLFSLYDLHFYVRYHDSVEETELWSVDEGRAVGMKGNIEKNEVIIDVPHDSKDESWIQYDKGAASKMINLAACSEFIIEKKYIKCNGKVVDEIVERVSVTPTIFKNTMIKNRRTNL